MKNILRSTSLVIVAVMLVSCLVSCAPTLSGCYYAGDKAITNTYIELDFSSSEVTISQITLGKTSWQTTAEYSIEDDKIVIDVPDDANILAKGYDGEFVLEEGEDYIKIGSVVYELSK